jgi:UDP-N-acetylglucosamine 2-epimerase (non-hydrolysing)/GDP/UDP-N,N'-diacetylbacillosamine 2-epimerase (hydrolysing)
VDSILALEPLSKSYLERLFHFRLRERNILVTFHAETTWDSQSGALVEPLLASLRELPDDIGIIVTGTNSDRGGKAIWQRLLNFTLEKPNRRTAIGSLGSEYYLSLLYHMDMVVGNSSSGLYEAPSFGIPSLDIGHRQEGRLRGTTVIHVPNEKDAILAGLWQGLNGGRLIPDNPYGDGRAATRIVDVLTTLPSREKLLRKNFAEIDKL